MRLIRTLPRPLRRARAAFTLVEILAVILIISILATFLVPQAIDAIETARTTACKKNLQEIGSGFKQYEIKYGKIPSESGARFFSVLISRGVWENTKSSARRLSCPAVDAGSLPGLEGREPTEWYTELEQVDGTCSAYAGRDCKNHPLRKFTGKDPLVADDNDGAMNHPTTTNVLYGDGAVESFELFELREKQTIGPDEEVLVVGPDSPVEDLRKFSLD
jgi:prepilin-type N-terminal cleavage/methylation domain-containing protein